MMKLYSLYGLVVVLLLLCVPLLTKTVCDMRCRSNDEPEGYCCSC